MGNVKPLPPISLSVLCTIVSFFSCEENLPKDVSFHYGIYHQAEQPYHDSIQGSEITRVSGRYYQPGPGGRLNRVRRKVDWILLPLLGFCYFLQFLDKQTLSYASLLGMLQDNNLHGSQFSWTISIFYFGYIFWSYPTIFLSVRLLIGKYLGGTV